MQWGPGVIQHEKVIVMLNNAWSLSLASHKNAIRNITDPTLLITNHEFYFIWVEFYVSFSCLMYPSKSFHVYSLLYVFFYIALLFCNRKEERCPCVGICVCQIQDSLICTSRAIHLLLFCCCFLSSIIAGYL